MTTPGEVAAPPPAKAWWDTLAYHLLFILALAASAWFYRERMIGDVAHWVWNITSLNSFVSPGTRWADYLLQAPAVVAVWLGCPLKIVLLVYSLSFTAFYYVIGALLWHGFRSRTAAWALLVFYIVRSGHCFVWPIETLSNGPALLFLMEPLLRAARRIKLVPRMCAVLVVTLLVCSIHPLATVCVVAILGLCFLEKSAYARGSIAVSAAAMAGMFLYKVFWDRWERSSMNTLNPAGMGMHIAEDLRYFIVHHGLAVVAIILAGVMLWRRQRRLGAVFLISLFCAYAALIFSRFHAQVDSWIYVWHMLIPLYAFSFLTWSMYDPKGWERWSWGVVSVAIALYCTAGAWSDIQWSRQRQDAILRMVHAGETPGKKTYAIDGRTMESLGPFGWSILDESLILTSLNGRAETRLLCVTPVPAWHPFWKHASNPDYFGIPAQVTENELVPLNTGAPAAAIADYAEKFLSLMHTPGTAQLAQSGGWVTVTLMNTGPDPFPSRSTDQGPVLIGYTWEKEGAVAQQEVSVKLLDIDVRSSYAVPMRVNAPKESGPHTLRFFVVLGGKPLNVRAWSSAG